jgi:hypothetical protein
MVAEAFFVHEDLRRCPVRPNAELEHQPIRRTPMHADEPALV